jgi:hypothetical protein
VRPTLATAPKTELARTLTNRNPAAARSYYVVKQPEDLTTYAHLVYGFPFPYLNDFTVEDVQEEGEFVLVQNPAVGMGFQLFITPDDQIGPHTAPRIRHDLPNMPMAEVTEFMLTDGTHAVRFVSHDL